MPRTSESFDKDLALLANSPTSALNDATRPLRKGSALAANDFAGEVEIGGTAVNTATGVMYVCTATDGATTATWVVLGAQTGP